MKNLQTVEAKMNCPRMNSFTVDGGIQALLIVYMCTFHTFGHCYFGQDFANGEEISLPFLLNHLFFIVSLHSLEKLKHFLVIDLLNILSD